MDGQIRKRPAGENIKETIRIWREANPDVMLSFEQLEALRRDHARSQAKCQSTETKKVA